MKTIIEQAYELDQLKSEYLQALKERNEAQYSMKFTVQVINGVEREVADDNDYARYELAYETLMLKERAIKRNIKNFATLLGFGLTDKALHGADNIAETVFALTQRAVHINEVLRESIRFNKYLTNI
ncbi:MAG: hypothetical protein NC328_02465 [Muribaculum sp.]|nr:hypothetical protein [Muribaculum sp.]